MKFKIAICVFSFIITLLLVSCKDYSGYKKVRFPSDKLGTVRLPNDWEFVVINEWITIVDIASDEIIGMQYYVGDKYLKKDETLDKRFYNPYFKDYVSIKSEYKSGNSNGSQFGIRKLESSVNIISFKFITFDSSNGSEFDIEILLLHEEISDELLKKICKSYKK